MSRCFPFPPPGYEAKLGSEHKDLLKKEKQKAKKHKKERTDGGERERKENKRDRKKDKHRKKHKREKHKDRAKKKERDKETRQILEHGTQKNDDLDNRIPKQIIHNKAVKDSKHKDELASHIKGQEGHANNTGSGTGKLLHRRVESFSVVGSKEKERTSVSRENEKSGQISQRNHGSEKGKDKTKVLNGMSIQVEPAEKHTTSIHGSNGVRPQHESSKGVLATTVATQQKRRITPSASAAQRTEQVDQHSEGSFHSAYTKSDTMSIKRMTEKKNGSAKFFHYSMDKQLVRGKSGAVQGNGKNQEEKANHQKGVKDGDRGHDVNHKAVKDRDRDHNVKKRKAKDGNEGQVRGKRSVGHEQKRKELDGHGTRKNYIHEMDSAHLKGNKFPSDDAKKREDLNAKSSLHEHSMRMTKMPRTSPAKHLHVNGETLKHSPETALCCSRLPVGTNPFEAHMLQHNNECYNNGITGTHYLEEHKSSVSSSSYDSSEVSLTPPHPDTKYLSQVYSIPAVEDCSEYVDQDWLFSGDRVHQKSTVLEAAQPPQVWAEAEIIDCADVVAMPYVFPL